MNRTMQRALRIGTSILALSVAAALGIAIAKGVVSFLKNVDVWAAIDNYEIGTILALGGIILLVVKDLLFALQKTGSYIWSGQASGPDLGEASIWLIEAMVAALYLASFSTNPLNAVLKAGKRASQARTA